MKQRKSSGKRHIAPAFLLGLLQAAAKPFRASGNNRRVRAIVAQPPFSMVNRRSHEEPFWSSTNFAAREQNWSATRPGT